MTTVHSPSVRAITVRTKIFRLLDSHPKGLSVAELARLAATDQSTVIAELRPLLQLASALGLTSPTAKAKPQPKTPTP